MKIYYDYLLLEQVNYLLAATDDGLIRLEGNGSLEKLAEHNPEDELIRDENQMLDYKLQLREYFSGNRTIFELPLQLNGTNFQKEVWEALLKIPYGQTITYQKVAEMIKRPNAVRAVGTAIGKNPIPIIIPCHRVIRTDGKLGGYSGAGGIEMKKRLLLIEELIS